MNKKTKLISFVIFILIIVTILGLRYYFIRTSLNNYWYGDENKVIYNSKITECNFSIFKPKVAFISEHLLLDDINELKVYFYDIKNIFSSNENNRLFTGVTTVKNTTFPELVTMVKEDCSQFQKAEGDQNDEIINWSYSPARTQEQLDEDEIDRLMREYSYLVPEAQLVFDEVYGDPYKMTNKELLELKNKIDEKGMDERVYIKDKVTIFHNGYSKLTDRQKRIILDTYGEWENLTDKELADYSARITEDHQSGKLVLE